MRDKLQQCRYYEPGHCSYHDDVLLGDEDIRCHAGGWDCFETDGLGVMPGPGGTWLSVPQFLDQVSQANVMPETLEVPAVFSVKLCPQCRAPLVYTTGQPTISCRMCKGAFDYVEPKPRDPKDSPLTVKQISDWEVEAREQLEFHMSVLPNTGPNAQP